MGTEQESRGLFFRSPAGLSPRRRRAESGFFDRGAGVRFGIAFGDEPAGHRAAVAAGGAAALSLADGGARAGCTVLRGHVAAGDGATRAAAS